MAEAETSQLPSAATYDELSAIERQFDDADTLIVATQHLLTLPLYTARATSIAKIPTFWALVFEQAPPDIDQYIQPSDSAVFASALTDFSVTRFEIRDDASVASISAADKGDSVRERLEKVGEPRSFSLKFEFKENEWFEDKVLEKKFYHRRTKHGEIVLRSTPVKIHWKTKDLTEGLTDAAFALWEAEQRNPDKDRKELKEYKHAKKMVEGTTEGAQSFFALFGYRGPSVSDEESREADAKFRRGESFGPDEMEPEKLDESLEAEEDVREEMETEVFGDAAELAMGLAEDLWPHALKYFANAQEVDDEDLSELEVDSAEVTEDEEMGVPDIRSLVKDSQRKSSGGQGAPPAKKRKT